jgi:bis(5'-nucleosyl)-tetraphosphatase (symmetrical)
MVHAGLLPQWSFTQAADLAGEVEDMLGSDNSVAFLHRMYGDTPRRWRDSLIGWDRLRFITNVFTRMRFCDHDGRIDLAYTGPPGTQPTTLQPWYAWRRSSGELLIFGHWSALGAAQIGDVICLDSGCVWGNSLTAARVDTRPVELTAVPCQET